MYRILTDVNNLQHVFSAFSANEALIVKYNIQRVFVQLKIPSAALLAQMHSEGLSLSAFEETKTSDTELQHSSDSVLRAHLATLFLVEKQLFAAMSMLTLSQQVEVRDLLETLSEHLRLPSETLLQRMAEEGLTLEKLGVVAKPADKLGQIRAKLQAAAVTEATEATEAKHKSVAEIKERLAALHISSRSPQQNESHEDKNIIHLKTIQERVSGSR
ncbi:hypothetical protein SAMN06297280_1829 [Arsukibacterium tuosuense]|uniref:Uncharacterized protein n=1 Tax=Arsukibacterium tuosuense TaxID=1323745 RepID=A0A285ITR0_9GAMM|nr:hypothetical protein [Arsukibacterium tuosuense]SNY51372.1 hypothetical protein SAMN06297280_1829 [Arsukibacterium tuosuense]